MKALAVLGGFVALIMLMALSAMLSGYALSVLWGWFVVPTFGLPPLTIAPAIGIAMVVSYMTHQIHDCKEEERSFGETLARGVTQAIFKPVFALCFGWVVHLFM